MHQLLLLVSQDRFEPSYLSMLDHQMLSMKFCDAPRHPLYGMRVFGKLWFGKFHFFNVLNRMRAAWRRAPQLRANR